MNLSLDLFAEPEPAQPTRRVLDTTSCCRSGSHPSNHALAFAAVVMPILPGHPAWERDENGRFRRGALESLANEILRGISSPSPALTPERWHAAKQHAPDFAKKRTP